MEKLMIKLVKGLAFNVENKQTSTNKLEFV
jgi:hypothetical protein